MLAWGTIDWLGGRPHQSAQNLGKLVSLKKLLLKNPRQGSFLSPALSCALDCSFSRLFSDCTHPCTPLFSAHSLVALSSCAAHGSMDCTYRMLDWIALSYGADTLGSNLYSGPGGDKIGLPWGERQRRDLEGGGNSLILHHQ